MQTTMLRLDAFLRRHRRAVLAAWAVTLLAAVPFAARQSEHLSSGGFGVPGSQSAAVDDALDRFPGVQRAQRAAVVVPLVSEVDEDDATAVAADLRERLAVADGPREGVATHLVGQGALWA